MVTTGCTKTENDPQIRAFMDAVGLVTGGAPLKFRDLQSPELMRYAGHFCILRRDEATRTLTYILWAGELAALYGKDLTNKEISEGDYGYAEDIFANLTHEVIDGQKPIYTSGSIDWDSREHMNWWMVTLPMLSQRGDTPNEAMCCIFWD